MTDLDRDIELTVAQINEALRLCGVELRNASTSMVYLERLIEQLRAAAENAADRILIDESEREGGKPIPWEKLRDEEATK